MIRRSGKPGGGAARNTKRLEKRFVVALFECRNRIGLVALSPLLPKQNELCRSPLSRDLGAGSVAARDAKVCISFKSPKDTVSCSEGLELSRFGSWRGWFSVQAQATIVIQRRGRQGVVLIYAITQQKVRTSVLKRGPRLLPANKRERRPSQAGFGTVLVGFR